MGFKRKLSTDIIKLHSFLPSGQASFSETDLFFSMPFHQFDKKKQTLAILPSWSRAPIVTYSIKLFNRPGHCGNFCFLESAFNTYKKCLIIQKSIKKEKLIYFYYKWLI